MAGETSSYKVCGLGRQGRMVVHWSCFRGIRCRRMTCAIYLVVDVRQIDTSLLQMWLMDGCVVVVFSMGILSKSTIALVDLAISGFLSRLGGCSGPFLFLIIYGSFHAAHSPSKSCILQGTSSECYIIEFKGVKFFFFWRQTGIFLQKKKSKSLLAVIKRTMNKEVQRWRLIRDLEWPWSCDLSFV